MIYYNFLGIIMFCTSLCIYVFEHCIHKMFPTDRIILIIEQIVSIILLSTTLYYTDIFLQELIPPEVVNMSTVIAYISISLFWWYMATRITNRIINLIFEKLIFPRINKREKIKEALASDPDSTIIIRFNDKNDTFRNLSVKRSLIPSDINIKVIGTITYIDKDKKIWSYQVYACEDISDEVRLKEIVYIATIENMQVEKSAQLSLEFNEKEN